MLNNGLRPRPSRVARLPENTWQGTCVYVCVCGGGTAQCKGTINQRVSGVGGNELQRKEVSVRERKTLQISE